MSEEEEEKRGFKIQDKRRFDETGSPRAGGEEHGGEEEPVSREAPLHEGTGPDRQAAQPVGGEQQQINFPSFVMSLATQALIQLGEMPPPEGFDIAPDRAAARQTIEILKMLEQKTQGNLDADEARLLKEILSTLQISFVRSKK